MKQFLVTLCFTLILFNASPSIAYDETKDPDLYFGSVAMDIPAIMHRRLKPLTEYLSKILNKNVVLKLSPNMTAAIQEISTSEVQLAYLTPVAYIKAHKKGSAHILVKTVTNNKSTFQLQIIVKDNSPIKKVSDLIGTKFAFGDKAALLHRATVVESGIQLNQLGNYKFIGHYDNIVRGVLNGDFDAGILKDTKVLKWKNKGIRVLYSSPQLPPYNISSSKNLTPYSRKKIIKALLDLDVTNPEHAEIIKSLSKQYTGFAATNDQEYNVVRKLVAPFSKINL
jgi:phosphonate transport system substrate-binding protein